MSSQLFPKFLGAESRASRNGFDLSSRDVFSTKVGQILPVKRVHVMPGSEVSIDLRHILRTDSIQTAAFARFKTTYDFYKVNYNDVYSGYNQYIAQREDKQLKSTPNTDQLPHFNLRDFVSHVLNVAFFDYLTDHPLSMSDGTMMYTKLSKSYTGYAKNIYAIQYSDGNRSVALDVIRNLDMFGYGNYLPRITAYYKVFQYVLEYYLSNEGGHTYDDLYAYGLNQFGDNNVIYSLPRVINKLYTDLSSGEHANLNQFVFSKLTSSTGTYFDNPIFTTIKNEDLNLWVPCAYNKIFENHYRNPYYDFKFTMVFNEQDLYGGYFQSGRYNFDYVELFNLDDYTSGMFDYDGEPYEQNRLLAIFAMKLHLYPKDMFTGVLPSTQFGDVSVFTDDRSWLNLQVVDTAGQGSAYQPLMSNSSSPALVGLGNGAPSAKFRFDPALAISVLNQRRADALQRFNENMLRAGNRTKSIFRAHFGYEPKSEQGHEAFYLGSFDGSIDLNTVTSTADTDNASLGEQGATGVGTISGKKIHITSDDFAVILGVFYIEKPTEYDAYGIDRFNEILDKWDVPYSELQNISLRPLSVARLNAASSFSDQQGLPEILGYLPAHIEYKTAVDLIHGEFYSNYPFDVDNQAVNTGRIDFRRGIFSNFVTPKTLTEFADEVRFLYIQPDSADQIFYNVSTASQDSDQFKVNLQADIFCVHPLSVIGLPY